MRRGQGDEFPCEVQGQRPCWGASADAGQRPIFCGVEGRQPSQVTKKHGRPVAAHVFWYNLLYQFDTWDCTCYNDVERGVLTMANVDKFTRAATGHLCAHYERAKDESGEYIRFGNQNIDASKTPLNYNLAPDHKGGQIEFIRRRTSEVKCLKREDVNVICSWVVTLPQGFSRESEFFEETYRFLSARYGQENVVSAYVHMDENQPHIHFCFVPVVDGKKGPKVSAKELLTKVELQRFHPALQTALERALGQDVPILNGATVGGNRTVTEMKADEDIAKARETVLAAEASAEIARDEVEGLQRQQSELQRDVAALQGRKERLLTEREVNALKGQRTITGALKGVTFDEYEALRRTARRVGKVDAEKADALKQVKAAEERAAAAEENARQSEKRAKEALTESPSVKMQIENVELRHRLERIERWLKKLLAIIPEQFRSIINNILRNREPFPEQRQGQRQDRDRGGMGL